MCKYKTKCKFDKVKSTENITLNKQGDVKYDDNIILYGRIVKPYLQRECKCFQNSLYLYKFQLDMKLIICFN